MKKLGLSLLVLLVLVGCATGNNNTPNNGSDNSNGNADVVAKVAYDGVIYEETDEVSTELTSDWGYSGKIIEVVAEEDLTGEHSGFVSNSVAEGTEIYMSTGVENSILVVTGESEFTTFTSAE